MKKFLCFPLLFVAITSQAYAQNTAIDLGTLGGATSAALDINDKEQVVGSSRTASGELHAFLWEGGVMKDLGQGEAIAINNHGAIVGNRVLGIDFESQSFQVEGILFQNGQQTTLPALEGDSLVQLYDINDRGQIVGTSGQSAVVWNEGQPSSLGTLGGESAAALSINNQGWIVGQSETADGEVHAFLWRDGAMTDLGSLGQGRTVAYAVNDRGQIVGESAGRAFLWEAGVMTELGRHGTSAKAYDINEQAQVSGEGDHWARNFPVLWTGAEGSIRDLALLPGSLWAESNAINEQGVVAGSTTYGVPSDHTPPVGPRATIWK